MFGGTWPVQFEYVDLILPAELELEWQARVAFVTTAELQMPFQGVLGTDGFLDKFAVTFNKYIGYFVVERPDDFHDRVGQHLISDSTPTADHRWLRGRGR